MTFTGKLMHMYLGKNCPKVSPWNIIMKKADLHIFSFQTFDHSAADKSVCL